MKSLEVTFPPCHSRVNNMYENYNYVNEDLTIVTAFTGKKYFVYLTFCESPFASLLTSCTKC